MTQPREQSLLLRQHESAHCLIAKDTLKTRALGDRRLDFERRR
jgi:hypothetical protein